MKKHTNTNVSTKFTPLYACILLLGLLLLPVWAVQAQGPVRTVVSITSVTPNPAYVQQTVEVSVRVDAVDPLAGTPAGKVEIHTGEDRLCAFDLDASGQGSCQLRFTDPGTIPLKALYLGAGSFVSSVSTETKLVVQDKHTPVFAITSHTPDPSVKDQSIEVSVQLTSAGPIPTGEVTVWRSDATCTAPPAASSADKCTIGLSTGMGACTLTPTTTGEIHLCASYPGDTFTQRAQAVAEHFVSDSNTYTLITNIDPEPSLLGETVWVSYEVGSPDGIPLATDLVKVTSGSLSCTGTIADGRCPLTFNTPHLHEVTAAYQGGGIPMQLTVLQNGFPLEPSTSKVVVHRVNAPPTDIVLSSVRVNVRSSIGSEIADISAVDPNPDETHVFTLVAGAGSADNALFRIDGDRLIVNAPIPSDRSFLSIRVRAMDPAELTFEKALRLQVTSDAVLPATGFPAGRVTELVPQPAEKQYRDLDGVWLEIPALGVKAEIVGMPFNEADGWDAAWLWNRIGWLDGTTFPSWQGNSGLAAHNYLPNGEPGPFASLHRLRWGNRLLVHVFGETHVYEVRSVEFVRPEETAALGHEESPWLTLVTCKSYDENTGSYRWRVVVRAEWVGVQ